MVLVNGFDAWVETPAGRYAISSQAYGPDVTYPDGAAADRLLRAGALAALGLRPAGRHEGGAGDLRAEGRLGRRGFVEVARRDGRPSPSRSGRSSRAATITRSITKTRRSPSRRRRAPAASCASSRMRTCRRSSCIRTGCTRPRPSGTGTSSMPRRRRGGSTFPRTSLPRGPFASISRARPSGWPPPRGTRARSARARAGGLARDAALGRAATAGVLPGPARPRGRRLPRPQRGGPDDRRGLSVVHGLGPRHVHRAPGPVPGHRPPGGSRGDPARMGRGGLRRDAAQPLSRQGRRARVQLRGRLALVRRGGLRLFRGHGRCGTPGVPGEGEEAPGRHRGDPRRLLARDALPDPRGRGRTALRRRARRAADVDGREGRGLGRHAAGSANPSRCRPCG